MEQKKVVLATIDTYRIGAADQLQIYAERMLMPFCVIYTAEELIQIINFYSNYDYILLDTAGHNYRNEELRDQMFSIIKSGYCTNRIRYISSAFFYNKL